MKIGLEKHLYIISSIFLMLFYPLNTLNFVIAEDLSVEDSTASEINVEEAYEAAESDDTHTEEASNNQDNSSDDGEDLKIYVDESPTETEESVEKPTVKIEETPVAEEVEKTIEIEELKVVEESKSDVISEETDGVTLDEKVSDDSEGEVNEESSEKSGWLHDIENVFEEIGSKIADTVNNVVEDIKNLVSGEDEEEIEELENIEESESVDNMDISDNEIELSKARENLNQEEIRGIYTHDGVTIVVTAPIESFPSETILIVTPIEDDSELESIKDKISETENISDNVVAFDISFLYRLESGEEIELQPLEGKTVEVSFDYTDNDKLIEAEESDTKEVQIFHINDKDEDGEKVEEGEEIVEKIEINEEKSEEIENGLVVDADGFSIYAISSTNTSEDIYRGIDANGILYISNSSIVVDGGNSIDLATLDKNGKFASDENLILADSWQGMGYNDSILQVKVIGEVAPLSTAHRFRGFYNCISIDLQGLDTSHVTDMSAMFLGCEALTSLDLSSFNTQNVTDMYSMFDGCEALTSLDLSSFNTQNVTDMAAMFEGCEALTSLDLSSFNTQNVTDMSFMFEGCEALTSLDLSSFDTLSVEYMNSMFFGCSSLSELNLGYFAVTPEITDLFDLLCETNNPKVFVSEDTESILRSEDRWEGSCASEVTFINSFEVTFIASPSTFLAGKFSDGDTSKTLTYTLTTGGYASAEGKEIQVPELSGYMFEGWYTDTDYTEAHRWAGLSGGTTYTEITLYARYLPFEDKTVTWGGVTFTMMDRNLGALEATSGYTNVIKPTVNNIGLYYQWGNNYGFENQGNLANTSTTLVVNNPSFPRGPGNYYYNGTFIINNTPPYRWDSTYEPNLRGGEGETVDKANLDTDKKGPCPEGYHVPSTYEWLASHNLFQKRQVTDEGSAYCNSISATNPGIQHCMLVSLGMSIAGYRSKTNSSVYHTGIYVFYQSSTAYNSGDVYLLYADQYSSTINPQYTFRRADAYPVRCFKNSDSLTLTFDSNGGSSIPSQTGFKRWNPRKTAPTVPSRTGSTFDGWYTDKELTQSFTFSDTTYVSEDTTLYAKWTCARGYHANISNTACEQDYIAIGIDNASTGTSVSITASSENNTITQTLDNLFRVEDMKGSSSGYYTTISASDLVGTINGKQYSIPKSNISLKVNMFGTISGKINGQVTKNSKFERFYPLGEEVMFIKRESGTEAGLFGKYGARSSIQIAIPAYTPVTTYKGTITYTLYDNA